MLTFGKHSGTEISNVPLPYLKWLCTSDQEVTSRCMYGVIQSIDLNASRAEIGVTFCDWIDGVPLPILEQDLWTRVRDIVSQKCSEYTKCTGHRILQQLLTLNVLHRNTVMEARKYRDVNRLCHHCMKKLVNIGYSRMGGADHSDWSTRKYHKKCWKKISPR